ncbi:MAG: molybdenum cofactor guanylyltransferase [Acidobacteriota bacterium]
MHTDSFILIGGRSSRLGADKAFLELGGSTLAERAVANVRDALAPERITMVAGSSTQFAIEGIKNDVPFIFDVHQDRGPLGGLHAALTDANTPWIFVLACDYPFVSPELIALLKENITNECGCVLPEQNDGRLQPLCAFYEVARTLPIVEEIIDTPRVTPPMHQIVTKLSPRIVKFDEYAHLDGADRLFVNINTREDFEAARSDLPV